MDFNLILYLTLFIIIISSINYYCFTRYYFNEVTKKEVKNPIKINISIVFNYKDDDDNLYLFMTKDHGTKLPSIYENKYYLPTFTLETLKDYKNEGVNEILYDFLQKKYPFLKYFLINSSYASPFMVYTDEKFNKNDNVLNIFYIIRDTSDCDTLDDYRKLSTDNFIDKLTPYGKWIKYTDIDKINKQGCYEVAFIDNNYENFIDYMPFSDFICC